MKLSTKKWGGLCALSVSWLLFTIIYSFYFVSVPIDSTRAYETAKFIFTSISAFGVLFTALFASFNSLEASSATKQRLDFDRIENTFSYLVRWDAPGLREARDVTRELKKHEDSLSKKAILEKVQTDQNVERSVITMFNFFEEMYLSIRVGRVDPLILHESLGEAYISIYNRFDIWVKEHLGEKHKKNLAELYNLWRR